MSQTLPERRSRRMPERFPSLGDLDMVGERMRRMLEQTFGEFGFSPFLSEEGGWSPSVDIEEQEDAYVVQAELPGVKREEINIEQIGTELSISGETQEQERQGVVRRRARRYGRFEYRVRLPDEVDADRIEAMLNDGVLTVRVPKSEMAQRRRIEVKSA